jgi:glyoxylase-like metal-dependent hydrolase (beta-lactamase superfamily II)
MRPVEVYASSGGARIYRIPLDVFPDMVGYAHLLYRDDLVALVDVGSGFGLSNEHLEAGLSTVREEHGEKAEWADLTHVLITHGHIDHYGGLRYVREHCRAPIGVHELDRPALTNYEERLNLSTQRLRAFLHLAGLETDQAEEIMDLYLINKHLFSSVDVDFTYEAVGMEIESLRLLHMPGHCPGEVVILVDDVLLSGDHVLETISPHQTPEHLLLNMGLGTYLDSLQRLMPYADEINLTLGGHEGPITDLRGRIHGIQRLHHERLNLMLSLLETPMTIVEIAREIFPDVRGYHELLALEEVGAHVEYLEQHGFLQVENLEGTNGRDPEPVLYRRREGVMLPLQIPGMAADHPEDLMQTGDPLNV